MTVQQLSIFVALIAIQTLATNSHPLIDNYVKCRNPSSKRTLDTCAQATLNEYGEVGALAGIPELRILRSDPIFIQELHLPMDLGNGVVKINLTINTVKMRGLAKWRIDSISINNRTGHGIGNIFVPQLRLQGRYDINGSVLGMPMVGISTFYYLLNSVNAVYDFQFGKTQSGVQIVKSTVMYDVKSNRFRFNNLFGGNELGEEMNKVLNDNAMQLHQLIRTTLGTAISPFFDRIVNSIIKNLPNDLQQEFYTKS